MKLLIACQQFRRFSWHVENLNVKSTTINLKLPYGNEFAFLLEGFWLSISTFNIYFEVREKILRTHIFTERLCRGRLCQFCSKICKLKGHTPFLTSCFVPSKTIPNELRVQTAAGASHFKWPYSVRHRRKNRNIFHGFVGHTVAPWLGILKCTMEATEWPSSKLKYPDKKFRPLKFSRSECSLHSRWPSCLDNRTLMGWCLSTEYMNSKSIVELSLGEKEEKKWFLRLKSCRQCWISEWYFD